MPSVQEIQLTSKGEIGLAVEGSSLSWPEAPGQPALPPLNVYDPQPRYFEIFNRGASLVHYSVVTGVPWLSVSRSNGTLSRDERIWVKVDWASIPPQTTQTSITVNVQDSRKIVVNVPIINPASPKATEIRGFVGIDGYVSIEAEHYTAKTEGNDLHWLRLPGFGRTLSAMTTLPVISQTIGSGHPHLDYQMYLFSAGDVSVDAYFAPTQKFQPGEGLRYGISFDDGSPQIMNLHTGYSQAEWERSVKDAIRIVTSKHKLVTSGVHLLKFWAIDPGVVLEKLVVNTGAVRSSYLGPPESLQR
jgi:glycosyl hydrolase family 115